MVVGVGAGNCRKVSILGSTGSIGVNTLSLLEKVDESFEVDVLTANRNVNLLADQAKRLKAKTAVIADASLYENLKQALAGTDIEVAAGAEAVNDAASRPVDWVMAAIVGAAGLAPTMAAIRTGATVALANKECLVCAGELMTRAVSQHNARLIPVDSEHSAIFQVFDSTQPEAVEKIILTASGGPFLSVDKHIMAQASPAQAIAHPNWSMGAKISIDSATMMNKGLELIEAYYLFPVKAEQIDIVIHPESVIHSMIEYVDGSVLAQLGTPDMCTPIAVALGWPKRIKVNRPKLNLTEIAKLTFAIPDTTKFPALTLAREALKAGGNAPIVLNAANEVAVEGFIQQRIGFLDIASIVAKCLEAMPWNHVENLETVMNIDQQARVLAEEYIRQRKNVA